MHRMLLLVLMVAAVSVVQAATSSFHHDLSPPLHEFTAPRAFLAQRFAERRAQEHQGQLRVEKSSKSSRSASNNNEQWNVRGGGMRDKDDAPPALRATTSASSDSRVPSLSHPVRTRRTIKIVCAEISVRLFAESILFVGSHLEPLGRRLGATVSNEESWRPALQGLHQHSRFLAGIALGFLLVR